MAQSIKQRVKSFKDVGQQKDLKAALDAARADSVALRAAFVALTAKLDVLTAKLNADGGVTDVNYAVDFASTLDPAATTLLA